MTASARILHAILALAVLSGSYAVYATLAVPRIEGDPHVDELRTAHIDDEPREAPTERYRDLIQSIFAEGSWERGDAKILKTPQLLLLFHDYRQLEDGRAHIFPCTLVFRSHGFSAAIPRPSDRQWVIQAVEGAVLQLDEPLDIRQSEVGKLVGAYVPGQVVINGSPTAAGGDAVEIVTRNVQFDRRRIWTPHHVKFRYGDSFGSGKDLTITLSDDSGSGVTRLKENISARVRAIELIELERLQFQLPPADHNDAAATPETVTVTSQGPLVMDVAVGTASISDQVKVLKTSGAGPGQSLACDRLFGHFQQGTASKLQLQRVVTEGSPVVVTAAVAAGGSRRLESQRLEYRLGQGGGLRGLGLGKFQTSANGNADPIEVSWAEQLIWKPGDGESLLQLVGAATARFGQRGQISSDSIQVWIRGDAASGGSFGAASAASANRDLRPRRLLAQGHVEMQSPELAAHTGTLDVLFTQPNPALGTGPASPLTLLPPGNSVAGPRSAKVRYDLRGDRMRLTLQLADDGVQVQDAAIDGHVNCLRQSVDAADRRGVELHGDLLELRDLPSAAATAQIRGQPARVRARQIDLTGNAIQLRRDTNRIWIDGAGTATLPLPPKLAGHYPRQAAVAHLAWQEKMEFDGETIACVRDVSVRGPAQLIRADSMSMRLNQRIDFSRPQQDGDADIDMIQVDGQVFLDNRSFDDFGLASVETARMARLIIEKGSGRIFGQGPGWIETVRKGSAKNPVGGILGQAVARGNATGGGAAQRRLIFLRVDFQKELVGNLQQRQVDFTDRVRTIYGPVEDWDERIEITDPSQLDGRSVTMRCDQLSILQKPGARGSSAVELLAIGRAMVEGRSFAARAHRLSYDQRKDLLVMEGNESGEAQLWRQERPGANRSELSASKIQFWPGSDRVRVDGMKSLDFAQ